MASAITLTTIMLLSFVFTVAAAAHLSRMIKLREERYAILEANVANNAEALMHPVLIGEPDPHNAGAYLEGRLSTDVWINADNHREPCSEKCWRLLETRLECVERTGGAPTTTSSTTTTTVPPDGCPEPQSTGIFRYRLEVLYETGIDCDGGTECERVNTRLTGFARQGFLDYQLHYDSDPHRLPFTPGVAYNGPVHTNQFALPPYNLPVCGAAVFKAGIETGDRVPRPGPEPIPGSWRTVEGCLDEAVPATQPVTGGQLTFVAQAEGTGGVGRGACGSVRMLAACERAFLDDTAWDTPTLTVDLTDLTALVETGADRNTHLDDEDNPADLSLPDAPPGEVVVHNTGDIAVSGAVPDGLNVTLVADGDIRITGNIAAQSIIALIAGGDIVIAHDSGDLELTNTALAALGIDSDDDPDNDPDGTLTSTRADQVVPVGDCPTLTLSGSLWEHTRHTIGAHIAGAGTVIGMCVNHHYPPDWALRVPSWWPSLSDHVWVRS